MGGHAHSHAPTADANRKWLAIALAINLGFAVVEVVAGLLSGSVALLSDAAHMVTDAGAIAIALVASRIAARPPTGRYTFGLRRAEILSAQFNGVTMLVLAAVIGFEAIRRVIDPPEVDGTAMIVIGVVGGLVNLAAAGALSRADRGNLNVEGAFLHNLADLWSSVAAAAAGVIILTTGQLEADALAALTVCALMLRAGWGLVRDSSAILLEGAPSSLDTQSLGREMARAPGVLEVHDLHVWELTSGYLALSAHVLVATDPERTPTRRALHEILQSRYDIAHVTLQVETGAERGLLQIDEHPAG